MHPFTKSLTAAILLLALLSAGCTDTGSSSANSPTAVATATQAATVESTPEVTENWWNDRPHYNLAIIKAEDNLFGIDFEGLLYDENPEIYIKILDENQNVIFKRETPTSFDPYDDLQPEQARDLEARYGEAKTVIMEQADTDGNGELDAVAVRYVGSKSDWTAHFEYHHDARVEDYIGSKLNPELYPMLTEYEF